mgnify:CR=1 FL=1
MNRIDRRIVLPGNSLQQKHTGYRACLSTTDNVVLKGITSMFPTCAFNDHCIKVFMCVCVCL